jgi:hypothetical protein
MELSNSLTKSLGPSVSRAYDVHTERCVGTSPAFEFPGGVHGFVQYNMLCGTLYLLERIIF